MLFFGCVERGERTENRNGGIEAIEVDSNRIWIDSAKSILKRNNELIKKGITKEMSSDEVNAAINPSMDAYFKLMQKISPQDTISLNEYRISLINELVDFQIIHSK